MAKEIVFVCPETLSFTNDDKALNISEKQEQSINAPRNAPLDPALHYVIVPQKNTAVNYRIIIDGTPQVRPSKRFFCVGFDDQGNFVEVRTVGVSTLRGMAYAFKEDGKAAPTIHVEINDEGNYRSAQGTSYVRAMDDTRFITAKDLRALVEKPVTFRALGQREAYASKFDNGKMVVNGDLAVLDIVNLKLFKKDSDPTEAEVTTALKACKEIGGDNFYEL